MFFSESGKQWRRQGWAWGHLRPPPKRIVFPPVFAPPLPTLREIKQMGIYLYKVVKTYDFFKILAPPPEKCLAFFSPQIFWCWRRHCGKAHSNIIVVEVPPPPNQVRESQITNNIFSDLWNVIRNIICTAMSKC